MNQIRAMINGKYWISPGARLGLAVVICMLTLVAAFTVFPALSARSASIQNHRDAVARQAVGAALLHRFDCTYGEAIRSTLLAAERSARTTAQLALSNRHRAFVRGDRQAANISLMSRRNAQKSAATYKHLRLQLAPLGRSYQGIPIPPCD